jgi:hypothetical protein
MADEGTVRRLAEAVGDVEGWLAFQERAVGWCRRNRPRSWGAFVMLARQRKPVGGVDGRVREHPKARGA